MLKTDTQRSMKSRDELKLPVFNWVGKKILIVEEDYVNYLLFHEMLSCSYACLIRAVSLQEAFDMLGSGTNFDLIIANANMPGNENCRSIKRIKLLWPHIRIIAISFNDCRNVKSHCSPSGCDIMINYGIDSYDMRTVVNEMFYPVN